VSSISTVTASTCPSLCRMVQRRRSYVRGLDQVGFEPSSLSLKERCRAVWFISGRS
jgi:hypothetical protein